VSDLPDLTTDPRARRVVKRPIAVAVAFAPANGVCETLEGPVGVRAGDAVLTGVKGERWPVQRHLFLSSYRPVPPTRTGQDGEYRKLPAITLALQIDRDLTVPVGWQDDPLQGHPGDWLLRYEDGSHSIVRDAIFRQTYDPADPPDRSAYTSGPKG
jgi:hypothetical protein